MAVASSLTVEVDIPGLHKRCAMLNHECSLMGSKAVRFSQTNRVKPELGNTIAVLDVNMRRFGCFKAVEEESKAKNPQNSWHE